MVKAKEGELFSSRIGRELKFSRSHLFGNLETRLYDLRRVNYLVERADRDRLALLSLNVRVDITVSRTA